MKTNEAETARENFEYWMFDTGEGIEVLTENHEYFTRKPDARLIVAKGTGRRELHRFATAILDHLQCHGFNKEGPECFESFPPSKAEHTAGRAVCDPEDHQPKSTDDISAKNRTLAEDQLQISCVGTAAVGWGVIAKSRFWEPSANDGPVVLITELASKEAAEVARAAAIKGCCEDPRFMDPYGYFACDNPAGEFNAIGRVLGALEDARSTLEGTDLVGLAAQTYWAATDQQEPNPLDREIPF